MRTFAFKTFGCRLNHAETAQFEAEFIAAGFTRVPFGSPADVLVVHSCAVTQKAETEGLRLLRALRTRCPDACLVLTGCAVEACGGEQLRALPVDLVVPHDKKDDLVSLVMRHLNLTRLPGPSVPALFTQRAALKVQDGCDFFCTYCIVPHTRGRPHSRPLDACLSEARALLASGFRELVVTGCNTACYEDGSHKLVDLLAALLELPDLGRIRLGSIEPGTVEREVVALMAQSPKFCRFLHLPIQSGDNGVLTRMGRRYTAETLSETLRETLRLMPDIGLGADVICGFPGESDEAFAHTRAFVQRFPFSKLHVFPYSERPGTPAAAFDGRVPATERKCRTQELIGQGKSNREIFAARFVGSRVEFLAEYVDKDERAHGWSGEYLACVVRGAPKNCRRTLCAFVPDAAKDGVLYGTWSD